MSKYAALTRSSLLLSKIASRAVADRRWSLALHHSSVCVSSRSFIVYGRRSLDIPRGKLDVWQRVKKSCIDDFRNTPWFADGLAGRQRH